jgi:hypothetical protein
MLDARFSWMKTVTKEEAELSRTRLLEWQSSGKEPKDGGQLGRWIYALPRHSPDRWGLPMEFPACPSAIGPDALAEYAAKLAPGSVFAANPLGAGSTVVMADLGTELLSVLVASPEGSLKGWAVSRVTVADGEFVHEWIGQYFTKEEALTVRSQLLGLSR